MQGKVSVKLWEKWGKCFHLRLVLAGGGWRFGTRTLSIGHQESRGRAWCTSCFVPLACRAYPWGDWVGWEAPVGPWTWEWTVLGMWAAMGVPTQCHQGVCPRLRHPGHCRRWMSIVSALTWFAARSSGVSSNSTAVPAQLSHCYPGWPPCSPASSYHYYYQNQHEKCPALIGCCCCLCTAIPEAAHWKQPLRSTQNGPKALLRLGPGETCRDVINLTFLQKIFALCAKRSTCKNTRSKKNSFTSV